MKNSPKTPTLNAKVVGYIAKKVGEKLYSHAKSANQ